MDKSADLKIETMKEFVYTRGSSIQYRKYQLISFIDPDGIQSLCANLSMLSSAPLREQTRDGGKSFRGEKKLKLINQPGLIITAIAQFICKQERGKEFMLDLKALPFGAARAKINHGKKWIKMVLYWASEKFPSLHEILRQA